jgi:hypothetical protein
MLEHKPKLILHPEPTLLDVVIGQSASILELLASKDESLLVRGNSCKRKKEPTLSAVEVENQT